MLNRLMNTAGFEITFAVVTYKGTYNNSVALQKYPYQTAELVAMKMQ
jgi:hypothetical protein